MSTLFEFFKHYPTILTFNFQIRQSNEDDDMSIQTKKNLEKN